MARIVSIIQFTGRAGSAVGSKGKGGKILLRQYQPTVANPKTAAQMQQRAKIKLAAQVAGMLGEVGRTALVANGLRKTDRGQLVKQLLKSINVNADGTKAMLGYDLNLIDNPCYNRALSLTVTSESNAYVATYSGAQEGEVIAKAILIHDLATGQWRHASAMDTNTTFSIGKSANESGDALEVFAYGIVLMPKTTEGFNNVGQTGADERGYVIDLSKVSTTNYDFSPCVSAALNVEGNGSTSGGTASTPGTDGSNSGNGGSQSGTQSGGNNGSQSGGSNGGSSTGSETNGTPVLTISKTGSGSASVTAGGNMVNSGASIAEDTQVSITITPATGMTPSATINGNNVSLTEDSGTYSGSFAMPGTNATLMINTGSSGDGDTN
jgi:hypothetical protein